MLLQARRHQVDFHPPPEAGTRQKGSSPESPGECSPNDTLISDFPRPELWENKLLLSKFEVHCDTAPAC